MTLTEFAKEAKHLRPGKYPTKELIQEYEITMKKDFLDIIRLWKNQHFDNKWGNDDNETKINKLIILMEEVTKGIKCHYPEFYPDKEIVPETKAKHYCMFFSEDKSKIKIGLDNQNPSIISTLHELGHAFLGFNELKACVFSQAIFHKVFPCQFNKLIWKGHLLKQCQQK